MKKFKFAVLILSLCAALSLLAACSPSAFSINGKNINYGGRNSEIKNCYVRIDPDLPLSSYASVPKSADNYTEVLKLFDGIGFSKSDETFDEGMVMHYDTVGLSAENLKIRLFILSDGNVIAEAVANGKTNYYKANSVLNHDNVHEIISGHLYI